ncbi:MAG TPA: heavy metal-binding domain-containing protein [Terriglobia bacterium]|nr:heavy metal-binding domain-containing protein [Terriglobia bacterium]
MERGSKSIVSFSRVTLLTALAASLIACSRAKPDDLPPVVYMCPMVKDAEVLEDHAGKCPKCGMELKPVRIVTAYSCLKNTAFIQAEPGKCRTDGSNLVPITASMFWACAASPDKHELDPGKCPDGSDRIRKFEPRVHGDHNPRHGGQLFMADDAWHHLEGTFPSKGLFRVFFYDDWTRPLSPEGFSARVIVRDSQGRDVSTIPLERSPISNAMEARLPNASVPLMASLRVRFKDGDPEKLFDFTFREYSKEPLPPAVTSAPEPAPPRGSPAPSTTAIADQTVQATTPVEDRPPETSTNLIVSTPLQQPIPPDAREVLAELNARSRDLANLIEQGAPLGEYWFPALRSKDLAMALLKDHLNKIPAGRRSAAEDATGRLLRAAFAIDNLGDLGDRERVLSAHEAFTSAINDLKSAYASIR